MSNYEVIDERQTIIDGKPFTLKLVKGWNKAEVQEAAKVLLTHIITTGKEIPYGDLAKKLSFNPSAEIVDHYLGELSYSCKESGLPPVSALVINKNEGMPGEGFYRAYYPHVKDPMERLAIGLKQMQAVKEYKHWDVVLKLFCQEEIETLVDPGYKFIQLLGDKKNIAKIQNKESGKLFVQKLYAPGSYNIEVFNRLKAMQIDGLPNLYEVRQVGEKLTTIEDFIEGKTYLEILKEEKVVSEEEAKKLVIALCDILKELHSMNPPIIHRDIKPQNILRSVEGKVYLIDFNASKNVNEDITEDTIAMATRHFGAPEQTIGSSASDARTDIFAIGATINYLLTQAFYNEMITIGKFRPIVEKCVKLQPENRYQSVEELKAAVMALD